MAGSTGPILAVGGITMFHQSVVLGKPMNLRIPVATGISAALFALAEKGWQQGTVALAYLALVGVLFVRLKPNEPSPIEAFVVWWEGGGNG